MALAILEFLDIEKGAALFKIDIGTNRFYQLKIGRKEQEREGINWVDDVSYTTPVTEKKTGINDLLNNGEELSIPAHRFDREANLVQLISFKNSSGRSPAYSRVLKIPVGRDRSAVPGLLTLSMSVNKQPMANATFKNCRTIQNNPKSSYAYQTGFEDIMATIAKIATPIISGLLQSSAPAAAAAAPQNAGTATAPQGPTAPPSVPQLGWVNVLLNTLLHGLQSVPALNVSTPKSLSLQPEVHPNRFTSYSDDKFSKPFFLPLLAAAAPLIGAAIGPLIQALPGILNAANEHKLKMREADTKLMTDLVADTSKRMILQQLLRNQELAADSDQSNPAVNQLLQLLQGGTDLSPAQISAILAAVPALATTHSLSLSNPYTAASNRYAAALSTGAILSFDLPDHIQWNGTGKNVYSKNSDIKLKIKLTVPVPAPKNPLPKAIIKFYFKDGGTGKVVFEKLFKQKNILPNTALEFSFTKDEIASVPENRDILVFAEMRWLTKGEKEIKTLGSTEIVLANGYFIKEQGKEAGEEKELTDMKRYSAFWNKIWEAPVLDAAKYTNRDTRKTIWELDVNGKYFYTLTPLHDSNGLMETKLLLGKKEEDGLTEKTEGRMKAGLEISIAELNKLCALWDNGAPLPPEKLEAFKQDGFIKKAAAEFIYNYRLQGNAGERGMIWVAPVLKLIQFTLCKIKTTNEYGLVTETEEEKVAYPLPVAARIIGLKSA